MSRIRLRLKPVLKDGLEPEYGPVPVPVPDSRWFDTVAVQRYLGNEWSSRALTSAEERGIHIIQVLRERK